MQYPTMMMDYFSIFRAAWLLVLQPVLH